MKMKVEILFFYAVVGLICYCLS